MTKKKIKLKDGRYLIYFVFQDDPRRAKLPLSRGSAGASPSHGGGKDRQGGAK